MDNFSDWITYRDIDDLIQLSDQCGLSDAHLKRLITMVGATGDKVLLSDLQQALMVSKNRHLSDPFYKSGNDPGCFEVGRTHSGARVGITKKQLNRNLLVVGETGSGKTIFFYNLMLQLLDKNIPFWALDYKQDFRHLYRMVDSDQVLVLRWEDLKFNPLRPPPGVSPARWAQVFSHSFADSQGLLTASQYFLFSHLYHLYNLYGVFEGKDRFPSFHELAEVLKYQRVPLSTKTARYLEVCQNRVQSIGLAIGDLLDCERGFPLDKLLTKNVIIELDGQVSEVQNFLAEIFLVWIYFYRLANGHRGGLRHLIFVDEARRLFDVNKERSFESGIPIIDDLTAKTREFTEGVVAASQELTKLTDSLKANSHSVLGLPLSSGKDIEELSRIMGLDTRQRKRLYQLDIGEGVFKRSGTRPVRVNTPLIHVDKGITTQEVKERMRKPLAWLNRQVKERFRPKDFDQYLQKLAGGHKIKSKAIVGEPSGEGLTQDSLSSVGKRLLIHIAEKPFIHLSKRYRELGISTYKGNRARKELLRRGIIEEVEINLGAGGRPKYFELTEEGEKLYRELKPDEDYVIKGGGDFKHRFWQHKISQYFNQKYYQTFIEYRLGDSQLDVFAVSNQKRVGIEVAMSSKGEVENIKKDLNLDLDELIVACQDPEVMSRVGKEAREKLGEKKVSEVRFCTVTDFLES